MGNKRIQRTQRTQKYFSEDDFYILTPPPKSARTPQHGKKCCGEHKNCKCIHGIKKGGK